MKTKIFFALILSCLFFTNIFAADYYVFPKGDDKNTGTQEKPFLTLERAKQAILKNSSEDCVVWLSDGVFRIEKPLVFSAEEFGSSNRKIVFKALGNATPEVSGGKLVANWKQNKDGIWEAKIKADAEFRELFVGNKRATRARFPNNDYLRVKKVGKDRRTNFYFNKNDFPIPEKVKDVELVLLHDWSISRIAVKEIDAQKKQLTAVDSIGAKNPAFFNLNHWEENPRYFLENDLAFLDVDYEWYFDKVKNTMFLKLPANKNPENLEIVYPVSKGLIEINGVSNIHFEGITFKHCNWNIPEMGYCGVQACHFDYRPNTKSKSQSSTITPNNKNGWMVVPAAIKADWAKNILFDKCIFQNLGTSGLWFSTGCKNCSVTNSIFSDISGNGIMIGEGRDRLVNENPWWQESPEEAALGNRIKNCSLSNCGVQFYGAVGIWCGLTAETTILNNEIYDLPYSGISIGWMWSPEPTPCRNNVIDGNHIHDILNILSDGGGIYMLGLQPGSKLVNNHIHDVKINAGRAESNGMFLDEGTTDVLVANNLIYNIAKSPLRFHKATTNLVKENYLFCTDGNPPIRYNRTEEDDIKKINNKVFSKEDTNYETLLKETIEKWMQNE